MTGDRGTQVPQSLKHVIRRLFSEVFPASRVKLIANPGPAHQDYVFASRDAANSRDGDSGNAGGNTFAARSGEEKFVVLSAVQGELPVNLPRRFAHAGARNQFRLNFRPGNALAADLRQIGGEAIAGVDHRCSQTLLAKDTAKFDS